MSFNFCLIVVTVRLFENGVLISKTAKNMYYFASRWKRKQLQLCELNCKGKRCKISDFLSWPKHVNATLKLNYNWNEKWYIAGKHCKIIYCNFKENIRLFSRLLIEFISGYENFLSKINALQNLSKYRAKFLNSLFLKYGKIDFSCIFTTKNTCAR